MRDFMFLMHNDTTSDASAEMWRSYIAALRERGVFGGGSSIAAGVSFRKGTPARPATEELSGYIRVRATDAEQAQQLLSGNPVFENGGTVEIRELPRD